MATEVMNYKDTAEIFTVVVQMGAILAVVWFYRLDLIKKILGIFNRDKQSINFLKKWIYATVPALLVGFLLKDYLTTYAVALTVGITLIIGGIAIWFIENYHKTAKNSSKPQLDDITYKQSIQIGAYQILALIPGVSRSGATIMGGMLSGVDRVTATAFSFYLSIPVIIIAGTYQLVSGRNEFDTVAGGGLALLVGTISAFVTALIAISWLLKYVSKHDFKGFAYYRVIVGIIILVAVV